MADVTLKNICKVYDSRERGHRGVLAVKDFTMDIHDEEFIVFVGPSGCGKSTTLRMIAGLEDISSGDLYIDGTYVNDVPAKDRNIAMVFQNYALYPHMTAYQNISFGLTLQKIEEPVYVGRRELAAERRLLAVTQTKLAEAQRRLSALQSLEQASAEEEPSEEIAALGSIIAQYESAIAKLERSIQEIEACFPELYAALQEIASARAQMRMEGARIAAAEKRIDATAKRINSYLKAIDVLADKARRVQDRNVRLEAVKAELSVIENRTSALQQSIAQGNAETERLQGEIASAKEKIESLQASIRTRQASIKKYQLLRIDKKKLAELAKTRTYYEKLSMSDEIIRQKDETELAGLEEELAGLEGAAEGSAAALRAEGLRGLIGRYREELDVLARRKVSIEQNLARTDADIEYYGKTEQPVFKYRRYTKTEIDQKVMRAAEILDIKKLLKRKPREMSGGQRQRIALGRAIVREPKVFLLDEPLSNLDAKLRTSMRSEIVKLHKQLKTTFIYVTHDQVEAMTMGTRIVVMKDGEVQQIDTPVNLFDHPLNTFVAGFIGTPQMNMFRVQMQAAGTKVKFTFGDGSVLTYDQKKLRPIAEEYLDGAPHAVVLGVRSENLFLAEKLSEKQEGFACTVTNIELLGSETNIYTVIDGVNITLTLNFRPAVSVGDQIFVGMNEGKLYLFDAETSRTILKR